ncbi:MAG: hypothetical protein MPN21_19015 [Thermoanaerobaculia bacterium]|nr:hypothetical protein [Thermoanaerobaculia bacterium]
MDRRRLLSHAADSLLAGEELSWQDARSGRPAVVVSASLARKYWGSTAAALYEIIGALGLPLGLCLSLGLQAALGHLLFGVRGNDPTTLAVASFSLLAVVLAASYFPARRAAVIDPIRVIRAD